MSSWTSSRSRPSAAGSVAGRTPWPRLNTWPGRPPARSSTSRVAAATRSHGPEEHRRVEVALHAAVLADERPADVERHAPVEPDHVAARVGQRCEQVRRPGPEVDRRHVDRVEDALEYGATNSR